MSRRLQVIFLTGLIGYFLGWMWPNGLEGDLAIFGLLGLLFSFIGWALLFIPQWGVWAGLQLIPVAILGFAGRVAIGYYIPISYALVPDFLFFSALTFVTAHIFFDEYRKHRNHTRSAQR